MNKGTAKTSKGISLKTKRIARMKRKTRTFLHLRLQWWTTSHHLRQRTQAPLPRSKRTRTTICLPQKFPQRRTYYLLLFATSLPLLPTKINCPVRTTRHSRLHHLHSTFCQRLSPCPQACRQVPTHRCPPPPPPPPPHTWRSSHRQASRQDPTKLRLERLSPQAYLEVKKMRRRRTKVRPPLRTRATAKPLVRKTQQFDLGAFCLEVKWRPAQARDDLDLET